MAFPRKVRPKDFCLIALCGVGLPNAWQLFGWRDIICRGGGMPWKTRTRPMADFLETGVLAKQAREKLEKTTDERIDDMGKLAMSKRPEYFPWQ